MPGCGYRLELVAGRGMQSTKDAATVAQRHTRHGGEMRFVMASFGPIHCELLWFNTVLISAVQVVRKSWASGTATDAAFRSLLTGLYDVFVLLHGRIGTLLEQVGEGRGGERFHGSQ